MGIPNEGDAGFPQQAEPDSVDIAILLAGTAGRGVLSGCAVTAQGSPDMTVAVAAGVIRNADGTSAAVTAGNVTITAAHATLPRTDLIIASAAGVLSCLAGTAGGRAAMTDPTTNIVLAAVYVPATDTAIDANQITDKRVILAVPDTSPSPYVYF